MTTVITAMANVIKDDQNMGKTPGAITRSIRWGKWDKDGETCLGSQDELGFKHDNKNVPRMVAPRMK